jgi:hypothetical protein
MLNVFQASRRNAARAIPLSAAADNLGMPYKMNLLHHVLAVQACARDFQVEADLDLLDLRMRLTGRNRYYDLFPRLVAVGEDGAPQYTPGAGPHARGFAGWLPYEHKRWPEAADKLQFKALCQRLGLRTPRHWTQPGAETRDVLVKHRGSSFGKGMRGPFRDVAGPDPGRGLREGEYYEQFMTGTIAKAWYWDDKPVALEMPAMPTVTGDGKRSLWELIVATAPRFLREGLVPSRFETIARYQGASLDGVVPAGKTLIADFRYLSPMFPPNPRNASVLSEHAGDALGKQLSDAGAALWQAIPEDVRKATLWTLDAIVEEDSGRVWLLEMNCNPLMHPDAYPAMFEGLFGPAQPLVFPAAAVSRAFPGFAPGSEPRFAPGATPGTASPFPSGPASAGPFGVPTPR